MNTLSEVWQWVSSEKLWLPNNITWQEVRALPHYPNPRDLQLTVPLALAFTILRFILDRILFIPIATALGIKDKSASVQSVPILEKAYKEKNTGEFKIKQLSLELEWTVRQVEIWFRRRKNSVAPRKKFVESAWRFTSYVGFVAWGMIVLWKDPCIFNSSECYSPLPTEQFVSRSHSWYYLAVLGFYISLSLSLGNDVKRKDFKIMVLHHGFTILMVTLGWIANTIRISSICILFHDLSDVPLEAAKLFEFAKKESLKTTFCIIFVLVWFITRFGYYMYYTYGCVVYAPTYTGLIPYIIFVTMLFALFGLHLIWTGMIVKIVYQTFTPKGLKDSRSDSEGSSEEEQENPKSK